MGALTGSQDDIQIRVTANDGSSNGSAATSVSTTVNNAAPTITARDSADLNGNGYIDAIHITFSENIDDTSVTATDFDIAGVTGEAFSSTTNSDTEDDADIYITFTDGTLATDATPNLTYTAGTLLDVYGNALVSNGPTATTDNAGPAILSAVAGDGINVGVGIDNDDTVTITFNEATNEPEISATNIDTVLNLNNAHTRKDGDGTIRSAVWESASVLVITLSTDISLPTIAVADTITDGTNNGSIAASPSITGNFLSNIAPTVTINSATQKTDGSGQVDISLEVDDADNDDTVRVKVEYKLGEDC